MKTHEYLCRSATGIVTEEAAEVIQIISKINRFGLLSDFKGETNKELLEGEIGDFLAGVSILSSLGVVNLDNIAKAMFDKFKRLKNWNPELIEQCDYCLFERNILNNFNQ